MTAIDVERIRDNIEAIELADRFFSTAEAQWLGSQSASERIGAFFVCWTAKEALLKARGTGLSMPLDEFTLIPDRGREQLQVEICSDEFPKNWSIWQLNFGPGLRAALAVQGTDITVRCGNWVWPLDSK